MTALDQQRAATKSLRFNFTQHTGLRTYAEPAWQNVEGELTFDADSPWKGRDEDELLEWLASIEANTNLTVEFDIRKTRMTITARIPMPDTNTEK